MSSHVVLLLVVIQIREIIGAVPSLVRESPLDEHAVVASFVKEVHKDNEGCLLVLGHDYSVLPPPLSRLLEDNVVQYGTNAAIKWTNSTPELPPNSGPGNFEYWFSWLERSSSKFLGNCALVVLIYHDNNAVPLLKHVASVVRLNPRADRVLYFSPDSDVQTAMMQSDHCEFLYQMGVAYDGPSSTLRIMNKCHYCNSGNPVIQQRGQYSKTLGPDPPGMQFYPDYSTNLHGKYLNISQVVKVTEEQIRHMYHNGHPVIIYFMCFLDCGDFLNYDWQFLLPEPVPGVPNEVRMDNGTWTGIVGTMSRRDNFMCGMFPTAEALKVADAPTAFYHTLFTYARRVPRPSYSWSTVFKPYTHGMWTAVLASAFVCSLIFLAILKVQYSIGQPFPPGQNPPRSNILYSFRFIFSALIEENPNLIPVPSSIRVLLCFWWLFSDLIVCGYEAKFFGFLVSPLMEELPSSMKEMATWPKWQWGSMDFLAAFIEMALEPSEMDYHQVILAKMLEGQEMVSCIMRASTEDYSCFCDADLLYSVAHLKMDLEGNLPIEVIRDTSLSTIGGIGTIKYSILTPVIRRFERRWDQAGMMQRYLSDFAYAFAMMGLESSRAEHLLYKLSMELKLSQLKGPMVILVGLLSASTVAFIGELIHFRTKRIKQ